MRILNKYLLALVSVIALTLGACTDSVDYEGATPVEGQGVYFSNTQASAITVDKASGDFVINVSRSKSEGALDGDLSVKIDEADAGVFTIPSKVSFADGETDSKITVNYQNVVEGKKYTITLTATDGTVYANSSQAFTVTYVSPDSEVWEVVSNKAVYIDNLFSPFNVGEKTFSQLKVEKAKDKNKYRFLSPYDNGYFEAKDVFGSKIFPDDFVPPYIIIDGDTYKDADGKPLWYISKTKLGFNMVNGVGPKYDLEWDTFGSVAYNLSTDIAKYPLGIYDSKIKMFNLGACYHNIGGYGAAALAAGSFKLYLDPSLMVPDFDKDYTWEDVTDVTGYFNSEVIKEKWSQAVQQAKEDPTFYRFPSLYAENVAIYFNYDAEKGTLTMPKQQLTGLTAQGNDIYVDAIANGTKVDKETNTFTFKLSLYLVDKDGKKAFELRKATETFLWGQGPLDQLVKGKKIDDYVGAWKVPFTDLKSGKVTTATVDISKADASTLLVKGLSVVKDYDDTMALGYNGETGYLEFVAQQTNPFQGYTLYVAPLNSVTSGIDLSGANKLTGGLTADGQLMFLDTPGNKGTYDSMAYVIVDDEGPSLATGYINGLIWQAQAAASYAPIGKFSLSNGKTMELNTNSKRVRKTELNLKGTPVQTNNTVKANSSIAPGTLIVR